MLNLDSVVGTGLNLSNLLMNRQQQLLEGMKILNSAVGARQSSVKFLMLNQKLCLVSSTIDNPFGEALWVNNRILTD